MTQRWRGSIKEILQGVRFMQNVRPMNASTTPKGHLSRVRFQVTEKNIKEACKANSRYCMIAEAIKAHLPDVRSISVDMMTIRWSDPATGWRYVYFTPKPAQYALIHFDMGLEIKIKPFSFQVRSGHAVPMNLGSGKDRRRAHKVTESKVLKTTDKGTIMHTVGSKSVPMHPAKIRPKIGPDYPRIDYTKPSQGRPKEWHPSHNTLREFGLRGFTEGFVPREG